MDPEAVLFVWIACGQGRQHLIGKGDGSVRCFATGFDRHGAGGAGFGNGDWIDDGQW